MFEEAEANGPFDATAGAGLVGTVVAPSWGGVGAVGTFGVCGPKGQNFGGRWQLPTLFGSHEPIKGIEGEDFVVRFR
jgi:hypothetical protein